MNRIAMIAACLLFSAPAFADTKVNGYYKSNGTYVEPHYRSDANSSKYDNYSSRGNTNPYTGEKGSSDPDKQPSSYDYGAKRYNYK